MLVGEPSFVATQIWVFLKMEKWGLFSRKRFDIEEKKKVLLCQVLFFVQKQMK